MSIDTLGRSRPDKEEIREAARWVAEEFEGEPVGELARIYVESTEDTKS